MLYDDFKKNKDLFLSDILDFLGLRTIEFDFIEKENVSGVPKVKWLNNLILSRSIVAKIIAKFFPSKLKSRFKIKLAKLNNAPPPKMHQETRTKLVDFYRKDIKKLEEIIGKDLSFWYE
jgi:hypothetical protein